jgi:hypothetical protein
VVGESAVDRGVKGRGIRGSRQVLVKGGALTFGVVAKGMPAWAWFVGSAGKVEWVIGGRDLPLRHPRDPGFSKGSNAEIPEIRVLAKEVMRR